MKRSNFLLHTFFLCIFIFANPVFASNKTVNVSERIHPRYEKIMKVKPATYNVYIDAPLKESEGAEVAAMYGLTNAMFGSAFAVNPNGLLVLTNAHVIVGSNFCTGRNKAPVNPSLTPNAPKTEAQKRKEGSPTFCILVRADTQILYRAELVFIDEGLDLAAFKIVSKITVPVLEFAELSDVKQGDDVLAFGAPLGHVDTVTNGIISHIERTSENGTILVQSNAQIDPGNSGGPLVDEITLQVVGMNSRYISPHITFAIRVDVIKKFYDRAIEKLSIRTP